MLTRFRQPTRAFVLRWAWASVVANTVIVLTGGAVRLTASGLGCPTWPRCTDSSFVAHRALGVHGAVEFGNRMLTYVLVAVAVGAWVAVWRWTVKGDRRRVLVTLLVLGIPVQGVIGGVTVLTDLNPWIVSLHLLLSLLLIAGSITLVRRVRETPAPGVPSAAATMVRLTYLCLWLVLYLGTVVTGSGPHAGDVDSPRNGLDPRALSQLHADAVFLLIGATVGCVLLLRTTGAPVSVVRNAVLLLGVELGQGLIGFVQYATDLPIVLVWFHLLGASILVAVATNLVLSILVDDSRPAFGTVAAQKIEYPPSTTRTSPVVKDDAGEAR